MRKRLRKIALAVIGAVLFAEVDRIELEPVDGFMAFKAGRVRYYAFGVRVPRAAWKCLIVPAATWLESSR